MTGRAPTIVVTQAEGGEGSLAASLVARGAEVLALPTIAILPPADTAPLDEALARIDRFDWIVFTSRHAVDAVCERPAWTQARTKALPRLRVAAVGRATARRLRDHGVTADLVPDTAGAEELGRWLSSTGAGLTLLWPRSDIAGRELPEGLRRAGAEVVDPIAYRTVPSPGCTGDPGGDLELLHRRLAEGSIQAITFMSPSSARGLCALLEAEDLALLGGRAVVASIGPTTSAALRDLGAPPDVESSEHSAEDLAATIMAYLESPPRAIG